MREYGDTFLLGPFREFYGEVIRLKRVIVTGTWQDAARQAPAEEFDAAPAGRGVEDFPEMVYDIGSQRGGALVPRAGGAAADWEAPGGRGGNGHGNGNGNGNGGGARLAAPGEGSASGYVWRRLHALFERQESRARRQGGAYGADFYKQAQYVMAALADEIFLNLDDNLDNVWEGRDSWVSNLLESRIFGTHVAGEAVFQRLDRLLVERDPVNRELAAVYLMALSLGFRGKYRSRDDGGELDEYRRKLFQFVFRREPDLDSKTRTRKLFHEAYSHTLREESGRRLPSPRAWLILLCAVVLAYVTLTHAVWSKLTGRVFVVNKCIQQTVDKLNQQPADKLSAAAPAARAADRPPDCP